MNQKGFECLVDQGKNGIQLDGEDGVAARFKTRKEESSIFSERWNRRKKIEHMLGSEGNVLDVGHMGLGGSSGAQLQFPQVVSNQEGVNSVSDCTVWEFARFQQIILMRITRRNGERTDSTMVVNNKCGQSSRLMMVSEEWPWHSSDWSRRPMTAVVLVLVHPRHAIFKSFLFENRKSEKETFV